VLNEIHIRGTGDLDKLILEPEHYQDSLSYSLEILNDPLAGSLLGDDIGLMIARFKCYLLEHDHKVIEVEQEEPARWIDYVKHGLKMRWPKLFRRLSPGYRVNVRKVPTGLYEVFPSDVIGKLQERYGMSHTKTIKRGKL